MSARWCLQAGFLAGRLMRFGFVNEMESVIDEARTVTHQQLSEHTEGLIDEPKQIKASLLAALPAPCLLLGPSPAHVARNAPWHRIWDHQSLALLTAAVLPVPSPRVISKQDRTSPTAPAPHARHTPPLWPPQANYEVAEVEPLETLIQSGGKYNFSTRAQSDAKALQFDVITTSLGPVILSNATRPVPFLTALARHCAWWPAVLIQDLCDSLQPHLAPAFVFGPWHHHAGTHMVRPSSPLCFYTCLAECASRTTAPLYRARSSSIPPSSRSRLVVLDIRFAGAAGARATRVLCAWSSPSNFQFVL